MESRLKATTIKGLKWLMFYKRTKRRYLKHTKDKFNFELKKDVFNALKIYREEHYYFVDKLNLYVETVKNQNIRYAMDKIINVGAYERD